MTEKLDRTRLEQIREACDEWDSDHTIYVGPWNTDGKPKPSTDIRWVRIDIEDIRGMLARIRQGEQDR